MADPQLGTKQICPNCQAKFYDLAKRPAHCPKCATEFDPDEAVRNRRTRARTIIPESDEVEDQVVAKETDDDEEEEEAVTPELDEVVDEPPLVTDDDDDGADDPVPVARKARNLVKRSRAIKPAFRANSSRRSSGPRRPRPAGPRSRTRRTRPRPRPPGTARRRRLRLLPRR